MLIAALVVPASVALAIACVAALLGAVIAAVHHAEVIAHRLGEPFGDPLILGLDSKDLVFLLLTWFVTLITFGSDRGHVMMGAVQLVIFGAFLFLVLVP